MAKNLTEAEVRERLQLHRKWRRHTITEKELIRCLELDRKFNRRGRA